jgi:hypothetical protein
MTTKISLLLAVGAFSMGLLSVQEIKSEEIDEREAVVLSPSEKAYVLNQMRLFVGSIQSIAEGLAAGEPSQVAEAAAARGSKRNINDPEFPSILAAKLPGAWKQFGGGLRKGFDRLSQGVADDQDAKRSLKQLGELMTSCAGCHAAYRIVDAQP